jgi:hypothetical protein
VKKLTPDISSILQKKQKQKNVKPLQGTIIIGLLIGLIYAGFSFALPWHWQLFLRWLVRGGEVKTIPTSLHQELNNLCKTANRSNYVNGYNGSKAIAYSLGKFECRLSRDQAHWVIHDLYGFDSTREAMKGSLIAVLLIKVVGQDYTYQINASISKS